VLYISLAFFFLPFLFFPNVGYIVSYIFFFYKNEKNGKKIVSFTEKEKNYSNFVLILTTARASAAILHLLFSESLLLLYVP
jgi:uncharacterized membrane protein